ncbi:MAG: hypothetical protein ABIH86_06670 [Planctomycetota bacterium]
MKRQAVRLALLLTLLTTASAFAQGDDKPEPPKDRAKIGLNFGVGYELFQDSRMIGVSQVIQIDYQMDEGITLFMHVEEQQIAFDDGVTTGDSTISYAGFGFRVSVQNFAFTGLAVGRSNMTGATNDATNSYGDIFGGVNLIRERTGNVEIDVFVELRYRFIESDDNVSPYADVENLNGFQAVLGMRIGF